VIVAVWAPGRGASSAWRNVPTWRCSPIWVDLTWNRVGRATSKLILIATGGVVYYGLLVRRELLRNLLNVSPWGPVLSTWAHYPNFIFVNPLNSAEFSPILSICGSTSPSVV